MISKKRSLTAIVLAAGRGARMRSRTPKLLHALLGRPLLEFPLRLAERVGCRNVVVVIGSGADDVRSRFENRPGLPLHWAYQDPPRGTGDAVRVALDELSRVEETVRGDHVLVLNGDLPLLSEESIEALIETHGRSAASFTLLALHRDDPTGYGRIRRDSDGEVAAIIEEADATAAEKSIAEVNGGVYVAAREALQRGLEALCQGTPDNSQNEFYLPPVIHPLREAGQKVATWTLPSERQHELQQVNTRVDLGRATAIRRDQIIQGFQESGVTVMDPALTYIEEDVEIGQDSVVFPFTVIRAGARIAAGCEVGPFAHIRQGTVLEPDVRIGNFTEVKESHIGRGSTAKHLSYIGNAELGDGVTIGAGTIFANFDGVKKSSTQVGDRAFVGSGTIFVAPVHMGEEAQTGAGAVVVKGRDINARETVVGVPARPLARKKPEERQQGRGRSER